MSAVDQALTTMAAGRIGLGLASRVAPRPTANAFGAGGVASPELDYMSRVFGARAFALGSGWLLSNGESRRLWQRLGFVCDISDTIAEVGHLRRRDIPRGQALGLLALTGTYAAFGAAKILGDLRQNGGVPA